VQQPLCPLGYAVVDGVTHPARTEGEELPADRCVVVIGYDDGTLVVRAATDSEAEQSAQGPTCGDLPPPASSVKTVPPPAVKRSLTEMKHSGLGIASLCLFGLVSLAMALGYSFFLAVQERDPREALGLVCCPGFGLPLLSLLGLGLSLGGLAQRHRRRVTAVVGLALHVLALLLLLAAFFAAKAQHKV
jgi:hypothetical protein